MFPYFLYEGSMSQTHIYKHALPAKLYSSRAIVQSVKSKPTCLLECIILQKLLLLLFSTLYPSDIHLDHAQESVSD